MVVKQKYNQDTDGLSQLELESVGDKVPAWEPAADWGLCVLSDPRLSNPAKMRKKYCWVNIAVCPCLHSPLTHKTNINPFENKVWEIYFYKEVCSFVYWSRDYCWLCFRIYLNMYVAIQQQFGFLQFFRLNNNNHSFAHSYLVSSITI